MQALLTFLATASVAMLAIITQPGAAMAQTCSIKCGCTGDGCGCQTQGGNGEECSATGIGCFVHECDAEEEDGELLVWAPDGTALRFEANADVRNGAVRFDHLPATKWDTSTPGRVVARSCRGLIVRSYFDRMTADRIRDQLAVLAI